MQKEKIKILISLLLILISSQKAINQNIVAIEKVLIEANRSNIYDFARKYEADSLLIASNSNSDISEILAISSPINIKSYGSAGSLGSISLRGLGSNMTTVLWNGFNINSLSTGDTDLSFYTGGFFQEIKISPGASSAINGSGTFGGIVELNNEAGKKENYISARAETGSFGTRKYSIKTKLSTEKIRYSIIYSNQKAENDFKYTDKLIDSEKIFTRKHNAYSYSGLLQNIDIKLKNNFTLESGFWLQGKEKEIPEAAGSFGESFKIQSDSSLKTYIKIDKYSKNRKITAAGAYFYDFLHYTDKLSSESQEYFVNSKIVANRFLTYVNYRYYKPKLIIDFGSNFKNYGVKTVNYKSEIKEYEGNIYFSTKTNFKKLNFTGNLSLVYSEFIKIKPIADLAITGVFFDNKLKTSFSASNKFRHPSFNEKYWQPGGNPQILYETGYSSQFSVDYFFINSNKNVLALYTTYFWGIINNMIQWIPLEGIWTAVNNKKVLSSGAETSLKYSFTKDKIRSNININYNYTASINKEYYSDFTELKGTQLIYVPKNNVKTFISIQYNNAGFCLSNIYTGLRYTTTDNDARYALEPNIVTNVSLFYSKKIKKLTFDVSFKISNIFNETYESIKSYPMPGRMFFFSAGLNYNLKK